VKCWYFFKMANAFDVLPMFVDSLFAKSTVSSIGFTLAFGMKLETKKSAGRIARVRNTVNDELALEVEEEEEEELEHSLKVMEQNR
jgi:hypothetical protein